MKKGGLTVASVTKRLQEFSGNLAAVARTFGVTRQAVFNFVHKRPALLAIADDVREGMKDNAESALQKAVLAGEAWAVCFFLKTQAKDRGYIERGELSVDGAVSQVNVTVRVVRDANFFGSAERIVALATSTPDGGAGSPGADEGRRVRAALGENGARSNGDG